MSETTTPVTQQQQQPQQQPKAPEVKKPVAGSYKNLWGQRIILADGRTMKLEDGHFLPKTDEEKALCKYYAEIGMLELVK